MKVHISQHDIGLCDLTITKQRDIYLIGRKMAEAGRISAFDIQATPALTKTVTCIQNLEWFVWDTELSSYPWVHLTLTDAGRKALGLT